MKVAAVRKIPTRKTMSSVVDSFDEVERVELLEAAYSVLNDNLLRSDFGIGTDLCEDYLLSLRDRLALALGE